VGWVCFKMAAQLRMLGIGSCTSETLWIGQCGDSGLCALTPDACNDVSLYIPPPWRDTCTNGYCSTQKFVLSAPEDVKPTQYGGCLHGTSNCLHTFSHRLLWLWILDICRKSARTQGRRVLVPYCICRTLSRRLRSWQW
jgi:hypothetical protein